MRCHGDKRKKVSVASFKWILYEKLNNDYADSFLAT